MPPPLNQRDTIQRAITSGGYLRTAMSGARDMLEHIIGCVPTGPVRNEATDINIEMMQLNERITRLVAAIEHLGEETAG